MNALDMIIEGAAATTEMQEAAREEVKVLRSTVLGLHCLIDNIRHEVERVRTYKEGINKGGQHAGIPHSQFINCGPAALNELHSICGHAYKVLLKLRPYRDDPILCEHANEVPYTCLCPIECYCKVNTCLGRG